MSTELMLDFVSPDGDFKLTYDYNGKTAYAYLKRNNEVVGEVWLFNQCEAPTTDEWRNQSNIPFANCRGFVVGDGKPIKPVEKGDVLVTWEQDATGPVAYIYLFEDLIGVVGLNDHPGYARLASKDGPLAKVMRIT